MSRFYGSLAGQGRIPVTRTGSAESGIKAHIRGWNVGAAVAVGTGHYDSDNGDDVVTVYMTSGSHGGLVWGAELLTIEQGPDGPVVTGMSDYLLERAKVLS